MIQHRLTRRIMAVVLILLLGGLLSVLMATPASAMEDVTTPTTLPTFDPTTLVLALTMATVEAIKRYAKWPTDLIWLPVVFLGVGFNIGYAMLFEGAIGPDLLTAAKTGLWLAISASGLYSLGKAAGSRSNAPPIETPAPPPTTQ